jgi:hypothetical protein
MAEQLPGFGQQRPGGQGHHVPQPGAEAAAEQLSLSRLVEKQIVLMQKQLEAMQPGPDALALSADISKLLAQLTAHRSEQAQQQQQQQERHARSRSGASAAASISSMMGHDPLEAMMEPGINSNPDFRAALGSRLGKSQGPDKVAGVLGYIDFTIRDVLQTSMPEVVLQALQQQGSAAGTSSTAAAAGAGSRAADTSARPSAAAGVQAPGSRGGPAATAAEGSGIARTKKGKRAAAAQVRELPFMSDFKSLSEMMTWFTQVCHHSNALLLALFDSLQRAGLAVWCSVLLPCCFQQLPQSLHLTLLLVGAGS